MTPKAVDYSAKTLSQLQALNAQSEGKLSLDPAFMRAFQSAANAADIDREKTARERISHVAMSIETATLKLLLPDLPATWEKAQGLTEHLQVLDPDFTGLTRVVLTITRNGGGEFAAAAGFRDARKPKNHADSRKAA